MPIMQLIYYIILVLFVAISIVISIISYKKKNDTKSTTVKKGEISTTGDNISILETILKNIPKYMINAEQFYNKLVPNGLQKTGVQKLADVLQKIKIDCLTNGITYDETVETVVKEKVEELIDLSKTVNSNSN